MNDRIMRLREESFAAEPSVSIERALLETRFYRENYGKHSLPVLRALVFMDLCEKKTIYLGDGELIVGERGPVPKCVPTFPELTCHSASDLRVLATRPMTRYPCQRRGYRNLRTRGHPLLDRPLHARTRLLPDS